MPCSLSFPEFIVSKKRIASVNPPDTYEHFVSLLQADDSHQIHQDVTPINTALQRSTAQNPLLAHVIERSWNLIWNCSLYITEPAVKAKKLDPRRAPDESLACCVGEEACVANTCQCLDAPMAVLPPPAPPPEVKVEEPPAQVRADAVGIARKLSMPPPVASAEPETAAPAEKKKRGGWLSWLFG